MAQPGWRGLTEFLWRWLGSIAGAVPATTISGESLFTPLVAGSSVITDVVTGDSEM